MLPAAKTAPAQTAIAMPASADSAAPRQAAIPAAPDAPAQAATHAAQTGPTQAAPSRRTVRHFLSQTAGVQTTLLKQAQNPAAPAAGSKAAAAVLFDLSAKPSAGNAAVDAGGPQAPTPSGLRPHSAGAKNILAVPLAVEKKTAKKRESRRFFRRWKTWLAAGALAAASLYGAYQYFGPRLDQIRPPDAVVIVDKSPYEMTVVPGNIIRDGTNPSLVLDGHDAAVRSFTVRADRKAAVSVDVNGAWKLWDLEDGKVYAPKNYPGKVRTALFTEEGRKLILIDTDGTVRISTLRTGTVQTIGRDLQSVLFDAISPDAQRVTLATKDNQVHVLELGSAKPTAFAVGGAVMAVGSTENGEMVLTTSKGIVKLWRIEAGKAPILVVQKYLPGLKIKDSALSAGGDRLLALAEMAGDEIVLAWRFGTEDVQMLMAYDFAGDDAVLAGVATTPDGARMAILGEDGRLWTWTPGQGEPVLVGKAASGAKVFFADGGAVIWTADKTGRLQAWTAD